MYNQTLVSKHNVYCADFETTSYPNLIKDGCVRVWLWSLVNCDDLTARYGTDIPSFLNTLTKLNAKIVFFHNLKFDGAFLTSYFLEHNLPFELIAPNNIWYAIRYGGVEFRDSLKKFRTTVKELSIMLGIELKKSVADDTGKSTWDYYIPQDYTPTIKEIDYCVHDSRIIAHAISNEYDNGRMRLTNSSEAYYNAQKKLRGFKKLFPKLPPIMDQISRKSYRGGVCSVNPIYANQELYDIYGYDVNGLYGYVMDECLLPCKEPYWGEPKSKNDLYIIDFDCEFEVKKNKFPFIQIKRSLQYYNRGTEFLRCSDGLTHLTLTSIDYELFKKHYKIYNFSNPQYMSFESRYNILSDVIQDNLRQKEYYSTPEHRNEYLRQVAKDNTNMLYGSFAISTIADECLPYLDSNGVMCIKHIKTQKDGRYIPMATFVTSQARKITIDAIQNNYDNWIYSDTDSMYLTKPAKGIKIDSKKSGYWKYETYGDFDKNWNGEPFPIGKFLRPKTYVLANENKEIYHFTNPTTGKFKSELRCAGMPDKVKESLCESITGFNDFKLGATFDGKLQHKVVKGGVCLMPIPYHIEG